MNLSQNIKKSIAKILVEGAAKRAVLLSSFARGDATEDSDIDLLIEFKGKKKSLLDLAALKMELQESLLFSYKKQDNHRLIP